MEAMAETIQRSQLFDHSELACGWWPYRMPRLQCRRSRLGLGQGRVTANECLGTKAKVQEKMNQFFGGLAHRNYPLPNPVTGPSML